MRRLIWTVTIIVVALAVYAGGQEEGSRSRRDREQPRLEEATPNPVDDINGYVVRTAAHWPGPERGLVSGDYVLDAWEEIMSEYNISREWIEMPNPDLVIEKMTATVLLGEPFADIIWIDGSRAIPTLADNNLILPLDDYIDFDDPRINRAIDPISTYKGKHYGYHPWVIAPGGGIWYNRTLLQREGMEDPMDLQERGEWTWDRFFEMARTANKDTDGDGEIDQFGITVGYEIEYPLLHSNGAFVVTETSPGQYEFSLDEPEALEALDFIAQLYDSNIMSYDSEPLFIAGRAAFYGGALFQGNNMLLNMEDDYGFVYWPKGPSADGYFTVSGPGAMIAIPANVNFPPEILGEIIVRTTPFEVMRDVQLEFIGSQVRTERDVNKILEMIDNTVYHLSVDNFPGLRREVGRIFRELRQGASAATAVEQFEQPAQAAIDAVGR
jgi:ABC-type glycerol-3-phosphate transport system substrate-binding protein